MPLVAALFLACVRSVQICIHSTWCLSIHCPPISTVSYSIINGAVLLSGFVSRVEGTGDILLIPKEARASLRVFSLFFALLVHVGGAAAWTKNV